MDIKKTVQDGGILLQAAGRLDTNTAPELQKALLDALQETNLLTLDFSDLVYLSSAGLRALLIAHKTAIAKGGRLTLENVQPEVMNVFQITGFSGLLNIREPA